MKKLFVSILLLFYFTVNTGFVVNLHYCMDKMASVEVGGDEHDSCGKCGMPVQDKEGCCRKEAKVIKLYQDVLPAYSIVPQFLELPAIIVTSEFLIASIQYTTTEAANQAHAPPLISKQDSYLKNRVFRI